jgi:hypothetical protein
MGSPPFSSEPKQLAAHLVFWPARRNFSFVLKNMATVGLNKPARVIGGSVIQRNDLIDQGS